MTRLSWSTLLGCLLAAVVTTGVVLAIWLDPHGHAVVWKSFWSVVVVNVAALFAALGFEGLQR